LLSERARIPTQGGGDELAHDPGVEGVAGETDTAVAEQVLRLAAALAHSRANMKQGEVTGAAAKITDEDELVVIEGRFVGVSRRDRLHFKVNPLKAGSRERLAQTGEGKRLILFGLRAHKPHRAAHHGIADRGVELRSAWRRRSARMREIRSSSVQWRPNTAVPVSERSDR
jgi:hypothetical protein